MKWMRGYGTKLVWNLGFRIKIIQSNHPIIQYKRQTCPKRLQTNLPKWVVTKQQNCMTKLGLCFGPRNSVMSTFNAPSNRNEAVLNSWKEGERWKDVCKLLTPSKNTPRFTCCWNEAQWGDDLGNQPVQVGVSWTLDVQVPAANIVEGLVVLKKMRTRSMRGKRAITTTTTRRRRRTTTTTRRTTTYIHVYIYIYTQLATESVRRVAYMMVTSVCSKREWTHLTLADSWWKPLTGNSFESYIWMFDLHPEHPELSCSKTKTCRGAVLCYRALPPRWPPVGSTTLWKRSCSSCRNPRTNAPTSGSPDQIQCHHRKHCTRRTLANLGLQLVRRAQNHAHRKRNNTVHWKNMKNYFLYLIRLQYVVVWISQTKI